MRSTILVFAFICSTLMHASGVLGQASLDTVSLSESGGPDGSVVKLAASGTAQELQETEVGDSGAENFSLDEDGFYAVADGDISSASSFFQESPQHQQSQVVPRAVKTSCSAAHTQRCQW